MTGATLEQIEALEVEHLSGYGGEVARLGPVRAVDAGPDLPVNVACGFGQSLDRLDEVEAFYAGRGLPSRLVLYSTFGHWAELAGRGYRLTQVLHVSARPLSRLPAASAWRVRPASPAEFLDLTVRAFGAGSAAIQARTAAHPQARLYAAEQEGHLVAAGALAVYGEGALLFSTVTLPAFRGQGAQAALLAERLQAASGGCRSGRRLGRRDNGARQHQRAQRESGRVPAGRRPAAAGAAPGRVTDAAVRPEPVGLLAVQHPVPGVPQGAGRQLKLSGLDQHVVGVIGAEREDAHVGPVQGVQHARQNAGQPEVEGAMQPQRGPAGGLLHVCRHRLGGADHREFVGSTRHRKQLSRGRPAGEGLGGGEPADGIFAGQDRKGERHAAV